MTVGAAIRTYSEDAKRLARSRAGVEVCDDALGAVRNKTRRRMRRLMLRDRLGN